MRKVESIKKLREICQSTDEAQTWRVRILRKCSIYATRLFLYTPISANQITMLMLLVGLISTIFFMKGNYFYSLIGLFLFYFHIILDCCDGEVARYRKKSSVGGIYLDLMAHMIINPLLIATMAIGSYFKNPLPIPDSTFLIAGFIGAYSLMIINLATLKKYEVWIKKRDLKVLDELSRTLADRTKGKMDSKMSKMKNRIYDLVSFKIFSLMFYFIIFNLVPFYVLFSAVMFSLFALIKIYYGYKEVNKLQ